MEQRAQRQGSWTSVLLFMAFLALWQLAALSPRIAYLFGDPWGTAHLLLEHTLDLSLPRHAAVTGAEAFSGFVIGVALGTVAGFSFWYAPRLAETLRPLMLVLSAVPIFAFAPMVIIWFGIGFWMKVAVSALGTFLIALAQSYEGARQVDADQLRLLKIFGASRASILRLVIIPSSLSWVFHSMRLNVGFALLGAFIGEFISSDEGIGYFMNRSGALYDIPSVLAGGCYLVILALMLQGLVQVMERGRTRILGCIAVSPKVRSYSRKKPAHRSRVWRRRRVS